MQAAPRLPCTSLVDRSQARQTGTGSLIGRYYDGSADKLFSALLSRKKLTQQQLDALEAILSELEDTP